MALGGIASSSSAPKTEILLLRALVKYLIKSVNFK